jgi:hypothetical protein
VFPAATVTAAATARRPSISSAFHDTIASTTLQGSLSTMACASGSRTIRATPDSTPAVTVALISSAIAIELITLISTHKAECAISSLINVLILSRLSRRIYYYIFLHVYARGRMVRSHVCELIEESLSLERLRLSLSNKTFGTRPHRLRT